MSKSELKKANDEFVKYWSNKNRCVCYYEPSDEYWKSSPKIAFCNLETYRGRNEAEKILLADSDVALGWYDDGNPTVVNTAKYNYFLRQMMQGKNYTQKQMQQNKDNEDLRNFLPQALYFNFRHTRKNSSKGVNLDSNGFYKDYYGCDGDFCREHYKQFIVAAEVEILVIGSKPGCDIINEIYPDLNLEYRSVKEHNGIVFASILHPSRFSYKDILNMKREISHIYNK